MLGRLQPKFGSRSITQHALERLPEAEARDFVWWAADGHSLLAAATPLAKGNLLVAIGYARNRGRLWSRAGPHIKASGR